MTFVETPAPPAVSSWRWALLGLLCLAQLMLILDVTVVNVALPDIGTDLHLHRAVQPWVLTAYTLAFGGLMLLGGRLADLVGDRRMLLIGLAVFTAASLTSGLAGSATALLAGRAVQGVGAALLSPAALSVLTTTFTGSQRGKALGAWAALSGAGSALGVVLGGVLTSGPGWRWIFFINVPIGVAVLLVLPGMVPTRQPLAGRGGVDVVGAATVTAATGAAIYGLINAGGHGWSAPSTVLPLVAAALLWGLFVLGERTIAAPLMSLQLLTRRPIVTGLVLMLVATGLLVGGFMLGSFWLQRGHGYSAVRVGLAFMPVAMATVAGAHAASRLLATLSPRLFVPMCLALAAAGDGVAARWTNPVSLVAGLSLAALGIGATFVTAFTFGLAAVQQEEAGIRSGVINTFHELGGALGVAVLSSVAGASLIAAHPAGAAFTRSFAVAAAVALGGVLLAALLIPPGNVTPGHSGHGH
jgi:EmrB/QacA subfamily drug resistance transporter